MPIRATERACGMPLDFKIVRAGLPNLFEMLVTIPVIATSQNKSHRMCFDLVAMVGEDQRKLSYVKMVSPCGRRTQIPVKLRWAKLLLFFRNEDGARVRLALGSEQGGLALA